MEPPRRKCLNLPQVRTGPDAGPPERPGLYPCPCCGYRTFPALPAEALAYICPVCLWENDLFNASDDEPSDENHGLTLNQGRENVRRYSVCDPHLAQYARPPRPEEARSP